MSEKMTRHNNTPAAMDAEDLEDDRLGKEWMTQIAKQLLLSKESTKEMFCKGDAKFLRRDGSELLGEAERRGKGWDSLGNFIFPTLHVPERKRDSGSDVYFSFSNDGLFAGLMHVPRIKASPVDKDVQTFRKGIWTLQDYFSVDLSHVLFIRKVGRKWLAGDHALTAERLDSFLEEQKELLEEDLDERRRYATIKVEANVEVDSFLASL